MRINKILHDRTARIEFILNNLLYFLIFAALIALSFVSPFFLEKSNLIAALKAASPILMVSVGLTFVVISGQMDLSVGSSVLASASICALLMTRAGWNPYLCFFLMIVLGTFFGFLNGFLIVKLDLNPWLVTLAMQFILKGVAFTFTKATSITMPSSVKAIRRIKLGSLPVYIIIVFLIALLMQVVLQHTKFGRESAAMGSNPNAAGKIGIHVNKLRIIIFTIAGLFSGLGAVTASINLGAVTQSLGNGYEFLGMTMVVIGGTSMAGGAGSVFPSTIFGVLMITLLENGLSIIGVDPYYFGILRGLVIFLAMYFDSMKNRKNS